MQKQSVFERFPALKQIPDNRFPSHVLIIPDGNGRWAKSKHSFVLQGHKRGAEHILRILRDLSELKPITIVTLWGFSADNWKRSEREVKGLLMLINFQIEQTLRELHERNARFVHLGRKDRIPEFLRKTIEKAEQQTAKNTGQIICLGIDFGGVDQELRMLEQAMKMQSKQQATQELLWTLRDGHGKIPPADLLIRTANEHRTSDIGWLNGAPTELYFIDKFFPEITTADIVDAIVDFSKRDRRFGGRKK